MRITNQNVNQAINRIQGDPSMSYWIKNAITALNKRDVVDAAHDAALLAIIMQARCGAILASEPAYVNRHASGSV